MTTGAGRTGSPNPKESQEVAERMLSLALGAGADGAEVLVREGSELEVKVRLGETEMVKEAGSRGLGLRVLKAGRVAVTYTSDFLPESLRRFAEESVALCQLAEPDEFAGLPAPEEMARAVPDLDLWDEAVMAIDVPHALRLALQGEQAARAWDARVTNSEGAAFGRNIGAVAFASSAGFSGAYRGSHVSLVVEPLCDDADGKKRNGYHYSSGRFFAELLSPDQVGIEAARRTVAKLGSRKIPTCQVPAIFSPEAGRSLLGQFAGVVSGGAVWRKSTYLAEREGTAVASPLVSIVDDPLIRRAAGSRPFDGEGLPVRPNVVVDRGLLRTFLLDVYAGRKLGRPSTGSAARSLGGGPHVSTSNFVLAAGTSAPTDLERVARAFYVTDLMGFGFNAVTGDFSQGAAGFWIENGERVHPVSEVTLSTNFDALWKGVEAVGNDLDTRSSVRCPSFRVGSVTIAGT
jgi:PmbA protein